MTLVTWFIETPCQNPMGQQERQSLLGIQTMKFKQSLDTYGFTNRWFLGFAARSNEMVEPKKLYCPHCGKQRTHDNKLIEWVDESGILDSL